MKLLLRPFRSKPIRQAFIPYPDDWRLFKIVYAPSAAWWNALLVVAVWWV